MSRFLLCWELGDRHAHLLRLVPLALQLRDLGHQVLFAVHDVQAGAGELSRHGLAFVPSPQALDALAPGPDHDLCYADELVRAGLGDRVALLGLVEAWRGIFSLFEPDALVIDNGPSALVAARVSGLPRLVLGDGYTLPSTLGWAAADGAIDGATDGTRRTVRLRSSERRVSEAVAGVMRLAVGGRPATRMQLFDPAECMLLTVAALDPFAPRPGTVYEGAHVRTDVGLPMNWKEAGPRVLLHLPDPTLAQEVAGVPALAGADVIGWGIRPRTRFVELQQVRPATRWVGSAICLDSVLPDADLCIHDGTHGMLSACLATGVPQIVVPSGGSSLAHAVCAAREDAVAIVSRLRIEESLGLHVDHALRGRAMRRSAAALRIRHARTGGTSVRTRLLSRALSLVDQDEAWPRFAATIGST
jgi:hypothetical protein